MRESVHAALLMRSTAEQLVSLHTGANTGVSAQCAVSVRSARAPLVLRRGFVCAGRGQRAALSRVTAFRPQGEGYVPQGGQVIRKLKQMTDTMEVR